MYSISYVAKILGVSYQTIYKLCKRGLVKHVRIGRIYRIDEEELKRLREIGTDANTK